MFVQYVRRKTSRTMYLAYRACIQCTYVTQSTDSILLQSMQADVLIVGGGVIGVATAYALCKSRSDLKVVLLEAGEFGAVSGRCGLQLVLVQPTDPCFHSRADAV